MIIVGSILSPLRKLCHRVREFVSVGRVCLSTGLMRISQKLWRDYDQIAYLTRKNLSISIISVVFPVQKTIDFPELLTVSERSVWKWGYLMQ